MFRKKVLLYYKMECKGMLKILSFYENYFKMCRIPDLDLCVLAIKGLQARFEKSKTKYDIKVGCKTRSWVTRKKNVFFIRWIF